MNTTHIYEINREFITRIYQIQRNTFYRSRACVDILPIRFYLFQGYANYNPETRQYDLEPLILQHRKTLKLRFSRERASKDVKTTMERFARYQRVIHGSPREANKLLSKLGRYLSSALNLPEDKHSEILAPVLQALQEAVPDKIIEVQSADIICRDTEESLDLRDDRPYRFRLIPATESFIQALEEASPVNDEEVCAICRDMFAQNKDSSSSITKLPCSHYYHRDCIVAWLHINHLCPTCRHPNAPSR